MLRKLLLVGVIVLLPGVARAASPVTSGGPRVGVSITPDQFVFGGQLTMREFAPDWSFSPNLELGVGDHATVIAPNFDVQYHLRLSGSDWRPYVGGGLGLAFVSVDLPYPYRDHSDTEVGLNVVLGFTVPTNSGNQWFTEMRLGIADLPDLKIVGGFNFKM